MTIGNTLINTPISPDMMRSGKKANIVVEVAVRTAGNISVAPFIAASFGGSPLSRCLYIFSATTIASSTSIPRAIRAPNKESIFKL